MAHLLRVKIKIAEESTFGGVERPQVIGFMHSPSLRFPSAFAPPRFLMRSTGAGRDEKLPLFAPKVPMPSLCSLYSIILASSESF